MAIMMELPQYMTFIVEPLHVRLCINVFIGTAHSYLYVHYICYTLRSKSYSDNSNDNVFVRKGIRILYARAFQFSINFILFFQC